MWKPSSSAALSCHRSRKVVPTTAPVRFDGAAGAYPRVEAEDGPSADSPGSDDLPPVPGPATAVGDGCCCCDSVTVVIGGGPAAVVVLGGPDLITARFDGPEANA